MTLKLIVFLLTVQTVISYKLLVRTRTYINDTYNIVSIKKDSPIDILSYRGFKTPIFEHNGVIFARPVITVKSCPTIVYYRFQSKNMTGYFLKLRIKVNKNPLQTARRFNFTQGIVWKSNRISYLPDAYFIDTNNTKIPAITRLHSYSNRSTYCDVMIYCRTIQQCGRQQVIFSTNTSKLGAALTFDIVGLVRRLDNGVEVWDFEGVRIATPIKKNCSWNLIQKSEDFQLSDDPILWVDHERGVWNPYDSYWIGLAALHFITYKKDQPYYKCKLRIELEDVMGNSYWGQWNQFQVMGAEDNYRLKVGDMVPGTLINGLEQYKNMQFSKHGKQSYFNKTDYTNYIKHLSYLAKYRAREFSKYENISENNMTYYLNYLNSWNTNISCSNREYRYVGWWFNLCFNVNTNANYNTSEIKGYTKVNTTGLKTGAKFNWVPIINTLMKVNCA